MKSFHLEVLSPERAFYIGDALSIVFPVEDGLIGVMADRSPLTAAIVPGEVTFTKPDGEKVVCAVSQGMIDVGHNDVKLLCESVLLPDEIDEEIERQNAESAAEDMKGKQSYKDYMLSQTLFARAMNNLKVKKHDASNINNS